MKTIPSVFFFKFSYFRYRLTPNCIEKFNLSTAEEQSPVKTIISNWAFCSEKLMHGNPSGLDNSICTVGSLLKFYKGSKPISVHLKMPLNVMLVNTCVDRSTATLVKHVVDLRSSHKELVDHIMNAMSSVVEDIIQVIMHVFFYLWNWQIILQFFQILETGEENYFENFERLITINNNLLRSLGVSHAKLEQIFTISEQCGFSSKLTGAGGGG